MKDIKSQIVNTLQEAADALENLQSNYDALDKIAQAATQLIHTFNRQGRVFSCGNGGSMCDAMHFAEELTGRYRLDRRPLAAIAISDSSHISCVGNDYGYEVAFSRYIEAHGRPGDTILAISTSGTSKNILLATEKAQAIGVQVIGLSGRLESPLKERSDIYIATPAGIFADRVQELHIKIIHLLIELVERDLFPELYLNIK